LHGLFDNARLRHAFLTQLHHGERPPLLPRAPLPTKEENFERLAELVRHSLDMKLVYKICGLGD
ncbi:MAG: cobyric acid synthase CobQ, partial [Dehalococcoidia bacterium]